MWLFDEAGRLRRVDVNTALGSSRGERLIDVRHEALKKGPRGWAASLYPGALQSQGLVHPVGGGLVDGNDHSLALEAASEKMLHQVLGNGLQPVVAGDEVVLPP